MANIEQLIKEVNKRFKSSIVNEGIQYESIPRIPFSSPRLNYMTYGGIPVRRIIEFSGDEGSGKTTSALDIVKHAQQMFPSRKVLYVDCENTLDPYWATLLGVDISDLILFQPQTETAEQIFSVIESFIQTDEVSLVVIDSLGVMVSAQAYEKGIEGKTYGGISAALTLFSKTVIPLLSRHDCTLIGINQMRDDMNSMYGGSTTTGGRGWKHNCSMRMEFRRSDYIDENGASVTRGVENPAGNLVKCHMIKTKVCRPDRKVGFYTLNYLQGIDYVTDTIDVAIKEGIITAAGAWYSLVDNNTGEIMSVGDRPMRFQGKQKLKEFLAANYDILEQITVQLQSKIIQIS